MDKKEGNYMNEIPNKHIQALNLMVKEFVDLIKTHEHKYDRTFASTVVLQIKRAFDFQIILAVK